MKFCVAFYPYGPHEKKNYLSISSDYKDSRGSCYPRATRARAMNIPRKGYRERISRFREFHWTRQVVFVIIHLENFPRKYGINPR